MAGPASGDDAALPAWIEQLPKAELHLHLEGSAGPETLVALAREQQGRSLSLEEARGRFRYRDFLGFLLAFKWVSEQLRSPADYAFLLRDLLPRLRRQNVRYAEITLSAGVVLWKKLERYVYDQHLLLIGYQEKAVFGATKRFRFTPRTLMTFWDADYDG